jgi:ArsR family transcriptional regulator, arsenate/arsenite/antimonite-responsive transcriptional repressor
MRDVLAVTGALADENRVRALMALHGGELCVCQITELLALAPSTVSKHLAILRGARLIDSRKDGRWIYYRLCGADAPAASKQAIEWLGQSLATDLQTRQDRKRLREILKQNPEELCRKQCRTNSKCCSSAPATRAGARWRKGGRVISRGR